VRCLKVVTAFDDNVAPHFLYSRSVIIAALTSHRSGATWERAAALCTADGQVDPSVVKRWHRHFVVGEGLLAEKPPSTHCSPGPVGEILLSPVGSWSPDLRSEDHWARSPPRQP
jgi:hypothetical protein